MYDVGIVSYGSAPLVARAMAAVLTQNPPPSRCVVVENSLDTRHWALLSELGSRWGSLNILVNLDPSVIEGYRTVSASTEILLLRSRENTGFCGGNNLALRHCASPAYLSLNPDCELGDHAVSFLTAGLVEDAAVVSGVLLKYPLPELETTYGLPAEAIDAVASVVSR